MPKRSFTKKPNEKSEDYHGTASLNSLPSSFAPGSTATVPRSINFNMTFDEALKFAVAVQSCVQSLNRYNRAIKAGRAMGLGLCILFDSKKISVMESRTE
jgi:hypothetical protein